jgi:hypothetical protein
MKIKRSVLLTFFWLVATAGLIPAFAVVGPGGGVNQEAKSWEVSLFGSNIKYKEPGLMQEKGSLTGFSGSYTLVFSDRYDACLELRAGWGKVDYTSAGTGSADGIEDKLIELRGIWEYGSSDKEGGFWRPYFGLGYRYLNDGLDTVVGGYQREANYTYLPLGVDCGVNVDNAWSLSFKAEYDMFLGGVQKSQLSDIDPSNHAYNDVHNQQRSGYGLRGSLRIARLGELRDWFLEPYVIYWNIKKSGTTDVTDFGQPTNWVAFEPKNNSTECGVKLGVRF